MIVYKDLCQLAPETLVPHECSLDAFHAGDQRQPKQHRILPTVVKLSSLQLPGCPEEGLGQLRRRISVHIYPPACLNSRIYSLFFQSFPIHVFYPENKKTAIRPRRPISAFPRGAEQRNAQAPAQESCAALVSPVPRTLPPVSWASPLQPHRTDSADKTPAAFPDT